MKLHAFKFASLCLFSLTAMTGASHAAGTEVKNNTKAVAKATLSAFGSSHETVCPAPYYKVANNPDVDASKGESLCKKNQAFCSSDYVGSTNHQTGSLTCTPKAEIVPPLDWKNATANGVVVYDSIQQPEVKCPKSTPTSPWATVFYRTSWDQMGCVVQKIAK